ncbi:MAG: UDP-N-acetylmuramate--L-alanine ligase [Candidatus Theseobacter exili]|nr:UDP-N-acetylmuramate--L-alanine ligase [Candidatus Theseobacter exili]
MIGKKPQQVHMVGVGGSGMSALAEIYINMGIRVTGSDMSDSKKIDVLKAKGITFYKGHSSHNISGADLIIVSSAIRPDNEELQEARRRGVNIISRAQALANQAEGKNILAVAGTHGKTTTCAMIGCIFVQASFDPFIALGGEASFLSGNGCYGSGKWALLEIDESDGSMKYFKPNCLLITNLEEEHLDFYGDINGLIDGFSTLANQTVDKAGFYCNGDDENMQKVIMKTGCKWISCGLDNISDWMAKEIYLEGMGSQFSLIKNGKFVSKISLQVPGIHNIRNALMAAAVCLDLGIDLEIVCNSLATFETVKRRFQILGQVNGILLVDDYAHHPTEIVASIEAARQLGGKVLAVFQPHRYTRTAVFQERFASSLALADEIALLPVYSSGESPIQGVTSENIKNNLLKNGKDRAVCIEHNQIDNWLKQVGRNGDIALFMGAGDLNKTAKEIISNEGFGK